MDVSTERVLEVYEETRDYGETARRVGLSYDAVRKRVKRNDRDPFPIIPGKSILYDAKTGDEKLIWATGKGAQGPSAQDVADAVHETLKDYKPPAGLKTSVSGNRDFLAFWPLPDLHMGLRAWQPEAGRDWDIRIAGDCFRNAIDGLAAALPDTKKALVLGIGDLLHADNYHYTTTNPNTNHVVDADGRFPKMLREAAAIVIYAVESARTKAEKVDVAIIRGNHDGASTAGIELAIEYYFRNDKRVTVLNNPSKHFIYEWGSNLLFSTHGDTLKLPKVAGYVAGAHAMAWGMARHRFAFTGHLHNEKTVEYPGITVEILQSPAAPDAWTVENGYCSGRSMQARLLSAKRGEVARYKEPV